MYGRDCLMIISLRRSDWCSEKGLTEMGLTSKSPRSLEEIWNPNPIRSDDLSVVVYTMFIVRVSKGFPDVMSSLIVMFTLIDLMRGLHSILAAVQHHHLKHCPILFSRSLKLHPKTTVSFDKSKPLLCRLGGPYAISCSITQNRK